MVGMIGRLWSGKGKILHKMFPLSFHKQLNCEWISAEQFYSWHKFKESKGSLGGKSILASDTPLPFSSPLTLDLFHPYQLTDVGGTSPGCYHQVQSAPQHL